MNISRLDLLFGQLVYEMTHRMSRAMSCFYLAVFGFYALILVVPKSYGLFGMLILALGLAIAIRRRVLHVSAQDWLFALLLMAFPLSLLPSLLVKGGTWEYFDYPVRALLFLPLIACLRGICQPERIQLYLLTGASTGGMLAALFSAKSLILDQVQRVGLPITNPIPFGQIAAILALLSLAGFMKSSDRGQKIYFGLGFLASVYTVYGSGSGGAFLSLIAGFLVELRFYWRALMAPRRGMYFLILILVVAAILAPLVIMKYEQYMQDYASFVASKGMGTSQGQRLISYALALESFLSSPFFGVGPGNGHLVIADYCSSHFCTEEFANWGGAHSQYFDVLMSAGLIGIIGWFVFTLGIAALFVFRIGSSGQEIAPVAGLSIVIAMMVAAMSQPLYNHNISVIFFFSTISFLWFSSLPSIQQSSITNEP